MFAPLHGIAEDPATGSANVTLIGLLADNADADDLVLQKHIAQGVDMGRPSFLIAEAEKRGRYRDGHAHCRPLRIGNGRTFVFGLIQWRRYAY